jgi:hypothetical protein
VEACEWVSVVNFCDSVGNSDFLKVCVVTVQIFTGQSQKY